MKGFVAQVTAEPAADVEEQPAEEFFDGLTRDREWHSEEKKRVVEQYRRLRHVIYKHIDDPAYFRVGSIRIAIFVIGFDADGNIAGIRTEAVET